MSEMIINGIGCLVLFAGGIALTGVAIGKASDFFWRKLCDANELRKIFEIIREHKEKKESGE